MTMEVPRITFDTNDSNARCLTEVYRQYDLRWSKSVISTRLRHPGLQHVAQCLLSVVMINLISYRSLALHATITCTTHRLVRLASLLYCQQTITITQLARPICVCCLEQGWHNTRHFGLSVDETLVLRPNAFVALLESMPHRHLSKNRHRLRRHRLRWIRPNGNGQFRVKKPGEVKL